VAELQGKENAGLAGNQTGISIRNNNPKPPTPYRKNSKNNAILKTGQKPLLNNKIEKKDPTEKRAFHAFCVKFTHWLRVKA
jgi:hypothetical protein